MTGVLSMLSIGAGAALAVVLVVLTLTLMAVPRAQDERISVADPPAWDLPLRALSALALVLALTALAGRLGAQLSGLLAPFPVVASVLAVFTHTQQGEDDLLRIMRGFVVGLVAYALFCFTLAVSLGSLQIAASFLLATAVALATQAVALTVTWRTRALPREPGFERVQLRAELGRQALEFREVLAELRQLGAPLLGRRRAAARPCPPRRRPAPRVSMPSRADRRDQPDRGLASPRRDRRSARTPTTARASSRRSPATGSARPRPCGTS